MIRVRHQRTWRLHTSSYNPYSNTWTSLPSLEENRYLRQIFVNNEDEMYALFSEQCIMDHIFGWRIRDGRRACRRKIGPFCSKEKSKEKHLSFITKYKPESNSWEDISSSDYLDLRQDFCIVAHENFIYFIGGVEWLGDECKFLSDVDRYDLGRSQWYKLASIQIARKWARGSAANGKIIIAGGVQKGGYRISSNNSRGRLFLFWHQKGAIIRGKAIIRGRRLFQIFLTGGRALSILFYYTIKSKN